MKTRWLLFALLAASLGVLLTCGVNVLGRTFDNKVDTAAVSYQGFPTVASVSEVGLGYPASGAKAAWPLLSATECLDADIYHFQLAETEAALGAAGMLLDKSDNAANTLDVSNAALAAGKTYFWRVRAHKTGDPAAMWGAWSATGSFIPDSGITGMVPADGGTSQALTLDWADVAGAASYEVKTASTDAGLASAQAAAVTPSTYAVPGQANVGDRIFWQVRPVRMGGMLGFWCAACSYTIVAAPDTTPPTVVSTVPAANAVGVATNADITATFSEAMNAATISTTTFTLKQGTTAVAGGVVTYSGTTATFNPTSNLSANTVFTATITTGATDLAGNALASNYSWSFTTAAVSSTLQMVSVPGGTFQMGSTTGYSDELPVHSVTVGSFRMSKYEVTQGQYQTVMGSNPASGYGVGTSFPVYYVTWYNAVGFCNALSVVDGLAQVYTINGWTVTADWSKNGYRLPTEAEWEYAARGGAGSLGCTYAGGNTVDTVAWYSGNAGSTSHAVGGKTGNELGLFDMSGNVWEWCWDWYGSYTTGAQTNPVGATSGAYRVVRGGYWNNDATYCRSAYRYSYYYAAPSDSYNIHFGFRVVAGP